MAGRWCLWQWRRLWKEMGASSIPLKSTGRTPSMSWHKSHSNGACACARKTRPAINAAQKPATLRLPVLVRGSRSSHRHCQAGPNAKDADTGADRAVSGQTHPTRIFGLRLRLAGQPDHFASGRWAWVQTQISTWQSKIDDFRPFASTQRPKWPCFVVRFASAHVRLANTTLVYCSVSEARLHMRVTLTPTKFKQGTSANASQAKLMVHTKGRTRYWYYEGLILKCNRKF